MSSDENEQQIIRIMVSNDGIGIPRRDIKRIFDPYYRSRVPDAVLKRSGTGIGLTIVKHAIEHIHEGEVRVKSEPLTGTPQGDDAAAIANMLHQTTFTVLLDRNKLDKLAEIAR
ncbi:MAG: ATP-binding protein [Planctomycetota bacterium]